MAKLIITYTEVRSREVDVDRSIGYADIQNLIAESVDSLLDPHSLMSGPTCTIEAVLEGHGRVLNQHVSGAAG